MKRKTFFKQAIKTFSLLLLVAILSLSATQLVSAGVWKKSGSRWWYQETNGSYPTNTWKAEHGKWYYFDNSGWMHTGWLRWHNNWYYLKGGNDGSMATNWLKVGNSWYFMHASGAMAEGWVHSGGKWYYLIGGGNGSMATGWIKVGDKDYFLHGSGAMAENEWIGQWYVGADGAWIPNYKVPAATPQPTKPPVTTPTQHTHTFVSNFTPSTCTVAGQAWDQCSSCGEKRNFKALPIKSHNFDYWERTKEPTTTQVGEESRRCKDCSYVERKEIAKNPIHQQVLVYNKTLSKQIFDEINNLRVKYGKEPCEEGVGITVQMAMIQAGSNVMQYDGTVNPLGRHGGASISMASVQKMDHRSAVDLVQNWENSNGHLRNIIDEPNGSVCTVAVYQYNDSEGKYWTSIIATFGPSIERDLQFKDNSTVIKQGLSSALPETEWGRLLNPDVIK